MTYKEQLESHHWQQKKLEILIRDNGRCVVCSTKDRVIHVHHLAYLHGRLAWEYDNEMLVTLCTKHHKEAHDEMPKTLSLISFFALKHGLTYIEIQEALQFLLDYKNKKI